MNTESTRSIKQEGVKLSLFLGGSAFCCGIGLIWLLSVGMSTHTFGVPVAIILAVGMFAGLNGFHKAQAVENQSLESQALENATSNEPPDSLSPNLLRASRYCPMSILICDQEGIITFGNDVLYANTGYEPEELAGKSITALAVPEKPLSAYATMLKQLQKDGKWRGELLTQGKNNTTFWESAHAITAPGTSDNNPHYIIFKDDISQRKAREEEANQRALHDALTQLPNRLSSLDRLEHLIAQAHRDQHNMAVLCVDMDDFKKINDTLGHEVGDHLLTKVAQRLTSIVAEGDLVGRLGGDEFMILLDGTNPNFHPEYIAESIIEQFRNAITFDGRELLLTASVGIALYPNDGETSSVLLRNADSAMYHAKSDGRNTYAFFTDNMNTQVARRLAVEERLHSAISRQEISVYYQPVVEIASNQICGVEALLRWNNPDLGMVEPSEFIPIAENNGMIVDLGRFLIKQSIHDITQWQKTLDPRLHLALNISPRQFRDTEMLNLVWETFEQHNMSEHTLVFEITEGVLMTGESNIYDTIKSLQASSIYLAMDDFGTGYSSLRYLRDYPFRVIKIDKSFTSGIEHDESDRQLIQSSIAMANGLEMDVVAEGVETKAQLNFLRDIECRFAQGYYFSKPLPFDAFTHYLENNHTKAPNNDNNA